MTSEPQVKLWEIAEFVINSDIPLVDAQRAFRQTLRSAALERTKGNKCAAARLLHVHRNTFERIGNEN